MADDPTPRPDQPNPPAPADEDLIAYLDGELDDATAREVETRLTGDASARARAETYKKTFDLLDYLPRTEPSPDFATRTMTRIQPVLTEAGEARNSTTAYPVVNPSTFSGSRIDLPRSSFRFSFILILGSLAALVSGYVAHAGLRNVLGDPTRESEQLTLADLRIIERLPMYFGVDDLDMLRRLDDPVLFAVEAVAPPSSNSRPEPAPPANRDRLIELFKSFPPARQQQLRILDQQLHDLPPAEQDRLERVLESYAVWLDHLNDADRHEVLSAPNAEARLEAIRRVRERQWREALPTRQKEQLKLMAEIKDQVQLIETLKATERVRRDEWSLARRQWDALQTPDLKPWPFSDPVLAREVDDYLKSALKVDLSKSDPKGELAPTTRLTRDEYITLRSQAEAANQSGHWFLYGLIIYQLAQSHPYLPEPRKGNPITEPSQLGADLMRELRKKGLGLLEKKATKGKWPDFALEVADASKKVAYSSESLGPCRPGEFPERVDTFLSKELLPKLKSDEREKLKGLEGKWPDYPRMMIRLAEEKNLSIPGVMLPGSPSLWSKYYSIQRPRPNSP